MIEDVIQLPVTAEGQNTPNIPRRVAIGLTSQGLNKLKLLLKLWESLEGRQQADLEQLLALCPGISRRFSIHGGKKVPHKPSTLSADLIRVLRLMQYTADLGLLVYRIFDQLRTGPNFLRQVINDGHANLDEETEKKDKEANLALISMCRPFMHKGLQAGQYVRSFKISDIEICLYSASKRDHNDTWDRYRLAHCLLLGFNPADDEYKELLDYDCTLKRCPGIEEAAEKHLHRVGFMRPPPAPAVASPVALPVAIPNALPNALPNAFPVDQPQDMQLFDNQQELWLQNYIPDNGNVDYGIMVEQQPYVFPNAAEPVNQHQNMQQNDISFEPYHAGMYNEVVPNHDLGNMMAQQPYVSPPVAEPGFQHQHMQLFDIQQEPWRPESVPHNDNVDFGDMMDQQPYISPPITEPGFQHQQLVQPNNEMSAFDFEPTVTFNVNHQTNPPPPTAESSDFGSSSNGNIWDMDELNHYPAYLATPSSMDGNVAEPVIPNINHITADFDHATAYDREWGALAAQIDAELQEMKRKNAE